MTGRAIAETVVALLVALVLTIVGIALLDLVDGADATTAFFDTSPRLVFGVLWPVLALWTLLVLIGNLRNRLRASGMKFLTGVVSTIVACVLTAVGWLVFSLVGGGWGLFLFAITLVPTVFFFVAAVISLLVTHLGFFRSSPTRA
ncbi:hypothetical protein ACX3O0_10420 [Homoserinimonas sp. A447]